MPTFRPRPPWLIGPFALTLVLALHLGIGLAWAATPDQFFDRAVRAYGRAKWSDAAAAFASFLAVAPQDRRVDDARFYRAEALVQAGRMAEADRIFSEIEAADPPGKWTPAARFRRGEIAIANQKHDQARKAFESCLASSRDRTHVAYSLTYLADMALERSDEDSLQRLVAERQRRNSLPPNLLVRFDRLVARHWIEHGQAASAWDLLNGPRRALASEDHFLLGLASLQVNEFQRGLEEVDKVVAHELPEGDAARLTLTRASLLIQLQRHTDAIAWLTMALELYPDMIDMHWCTQALIDSLARSGRLPEAAWWWQQGESRASGANQWHAAGLELADKAYGSAMFDTASQLYQAVLEHSENDSTVAAKALSGLAWCARKLGDVPHAITLCEEWLERFPRDRQRPSLLLTLAELHEAAGSPTLAITAYRQLTDLKPAPAEAPAALLALARLQRRTQARETAESILRQLIADFPHFRRLDEALYERSWILFELEQRAEAARGWQRIVVEFPESALVTDSLFRLAVDAEHRGQPKEARSWLSELWQRPLPADIGEQALHLEARILASEGNWGDLEARMRSLATSTDRPAMRRAAEYWLAEGCFRRHAWQEAATRFGRLDQELQDDERETLAGSDTAERPERHEEGPHRSKEVDLWRIQVARRHAESLARLSQWTSALQVAESVQSRYPGFRWNYEMDFVRGQCLEALGRASDAREAWSLVVRSPLGGRTETAAAAQWQIGKSWEMAEDLAAAIAAYEAVERLFPDSAWRTRATLARGYCLERAGDPRAAVRCFAEVIREQGSNSWSKEAESALRRARRSALAREAPQIPSAMR